jgi:hypothetical protein
MKTFAYVILVFLVLLSLALNFSVLYTLWTARETTLDALAQALVALDQMSAALADLENETFEMTFPVQESIPINTEVPFRRELTIPLDLDVPISDEIVIQEQFEVPISTPLFDFAVDVPVSSTIPVELVVPVRGEVSVVIDEVFPVNTDVQIDLTVPIAIEMADTPLPAYLAEADTMLEGMRTMLEEMQIQLSSTPQFLPQNP